MTREDPPPPVVTSAQQPEFTPQQLLLYRRVLRDFQGNRVPFAIAGGFAFHAYTGIWRYTKDLDVFLPAEWMDRALAIGSRASFVTELRDPVWLGKIWHGDYFVDLISGMSNGVIAVTPQWIELSHRSIVVGVDVPLLGPEEMILSKIFVAHRDRFDGSDVAHLIFSVGDQLDWQRILAGAGDHWELLLWHLTLYRYVYPMAAHRVPKEIWEELLGRFRHVLSGAGPGQAFRGSLIDENMFQFDVSEWGMPDLHAVHRALRLKRQDGEKSA
jgi:hypothetical protein